MTEKRACFITRAGRGQGMDGAGDEPSHIHLPRRRRVARPVDQGERTIWADEEQRGQAHPSVPEA